MAYTYAQLVQMGAKPGPSAGSSPAGKSYTYDDLVKAGATPGEAPAPAAPKLSLDEQGAKDTGAFFPAKTSQGGTQQGGGFEEALKVIPNMIPSAFGVVKGLAHAVFHPIDTASQIIQHPYESLVPEAARGLVTAAHGAFTGNHEEIGRGLETAQRDIINDPVGSILPFIALGEGGAAALDKLGVTTDAAGSFGRGISRTAGVATDVADIATKPIRGAFGKVASVAGKGVDFTKSAAGFAARQATGIDAGTAAEFAKDTSLKPVNAEGLITKREDLGGQIQNALATKKAEMGVSPETLGQEVQSALAKRSADLEETGKSYAPVRASEAPIKVDPGFLKSTIEDTTGLKVGPKGEITTNAAAKIRDATDVRAVNNFYKTYQPLFEKGSMTTNEFLNMRADLAKVSKFEKEFAKSSDLEASAQIMRGKINTSLRPQVEGLSKLDTEFSAQSKEIKALSKGLVDKSGTLTDTGLSKVAKATAAKPQLLAQLEQVAPGITDRINALHQFNDLGKGLIDENGNITDQGMKKITNASNESNPQTLARLEQIKPGITKLIKQYKALQDVVNASEKFKVGTYGRNLGMAGVMGGIMTLNPMLVGGAVAEMILTNPENAIKILQTYATKRPIYDAVVSRLKAGTQKALKAINESPNKVLTPGAFTPRQSTPVQ